MKSQTLEPVRIGDDVEEGSGMSGSGMSEASGAADVIYNDSEVEILESGLKSTEKVLKRNINASDWSVSASETLSDLTCHEMNQELLNLTIAEKERCDKQALDFASEESLKLSNEKDELIKNNLLLDNALCSKISKKYFPFGFENLMPQSLKDLCGDLQGNLEKYHAFNILIEVK